MMRPLLIMAAISGFFAVLLGAAGTHILAPHMTDRGLQLYQTASLYHLIHSLALLGCSLLAPYAASSLRATMLLKLSATAFMTGIILFSGVLYVTALFPGAGLHILIPFGGVSFMTGWLLLAGVAISKKQTGPRS